MDENVLETEIKNLSKNHKDIHLPIKKDPNNPTTDPNNSNYKVNSRFSCNFTKYSWSVKTKHQATPIVKEKEIVYTARNDFDVILDTRLHIELPTISVKDKWKHAIEICYPHNPGHNIVYKGELKINNKRHQRIDTIWMDNYSQHNRKHGYDIMIGNIPCLTDWKTELPAKTLSVHQPYHYTKNTRVGLLVLKSSGDIKYHYKIRKIHEVLRMRKKILDENKNPVWVEMKKVDMNYLNSDENFPIPKLWNDYSLVTDEERYWLKGIDPLTKKPLIDPVTNEKIKRVIYVDNIINIKKEVSFGNTCIIPLKTKIPCKALFWVAQNKKCIAYRNFSNYTTNYDNLNQGSNPCSVVSLQYGGIKKFDKLSNIHFDKDEPHDHSKSIPAEPGYSVYYYGYEPSTLNADTAMVLRTLDASLEITLGNVLIDNKKSEEKYDKDGKLIPQEEKELDEYIIHVRALVSKKIETVWNEKDKRLKYLIEN